MQQGLRIDRAANRPTKAEEPSGNASCSTSRPQRGGVGMGKIDKRRVRSIRYFGSIHPDLFFSDDADEWLLEDVQAPQTIVRGWANHYSRTRTPCNVERESDLLTDALVNA